MDLTNNDILVTSWEIDELDNTLTLTFKDVTEATTLGTMVVDTTKFRSLVDALNQVGQALFPTEQNLTTREKHRTSFNTKTQKSTTEFL
ncbi:MAG: hypothetical protein EBZ49_00145 [Proteobacteria bacterium]|nr:hypothetical protein [Pseudomonadota bacterium]